MSKIRIKVAIMAAAMLLMTSGILNGLFAEIAKSYPDTPMNLLVMVLTLPFFVGTATSVLAGPIAKLTSKKNVTLAGIIIVLSGGVLGLFTAKISVNYLLVSSALLGVGQGLLSTLTMALPADYFEGQERASLMGLQSSFVNYGGMLLAFIAALLSGIDWTYAYFVTFITIPLFIVVLAYLPKQEPTASEPKTTVTEAVIEKGKLNKFVITILIIDAIYAAFMFTFSANFALFIDMYAIGTVTSAGLVQTVTTMIGGFTGIIYGKLFKGLKSQIATVAFVVTAIGMIQMVIFGGIANVFIAGILSGFGLTATIPTLFYNVSNSVKPSMNALALGILNAVGSMAIFLSPVIVGAVSSIFMSEPTIEGKLILSSIVLLALAVVSFFVFRKHDKKEA